MMKFRNLLALFIFILLLQACTAKKPVAVKLVTEPNITVMPAPVIDSAQILSEIKLPEVPREFRAAWVATVANINWPSRNNLSSDQQKDEAIALLDMLQENNFNAVVFQVRPAADAFYPSPYEPWSFFLTGETGKAPSPYYDPLEFWVAEAHKRGMQLHVWLNPYRAHYTTGKINSESMVRRSPDNIVRLSNGTWWFDPANQKTQDHVSLVVKDLVSRYDLDGVHFDDYFYPYREYNGGADFPDYKSWSAYLSAGGTLSRADWRRDNVNRFIERIYTEIKAAKPAVQFGISPFGIWKPGYPQGIIGSSQYDELYADAKLWLNKGWVDYFAPQLYWPIDSNQSFTSLLQWWKDENTHGRHLWPGLNTVGIRNVDKPTEIVSQIAEIRRIVPQSSGAIHYSVAGLTDNAFMLNALRQGPYREKALVPKSPWLVNSQPTKPRLFEAANESISSITLVPQENDKVFRWILYLKYGDNWTTEVLDGADTFKKVLVNKNGRRLNAVAARTVDRLGNESDAAIKLLNAAPAAPSAVSAVSAQ